MTLEVREIIFILIGLVAVYVVVQVLRAAGSRKAPAPTVAPQVAAEPPAVAAPTPAEPATPAPSRHDAVRERAEQLALELEVQQLRRDLRQLRTEHDNQRHELEHLAAELARMQEAVGTLQAG